MFRKTRVVFLTALMLTAFTAMAGNTYVNIEQHLTPEQLHETGLDTLSPEQLKRLNQLLSDDAEQIAKIEKLQQKNGASQPSYIGLDDKPIKSRLKGTISGLDVDTVFEPGNGQCWKVLKVHMKLRKPVESPEIIVVPGIAGRWFLQVEKICRRHGCIVSTDRIGFDLLCSHLAGQ